MAILNSTPDATMPTYNGTLYNTSNSSSPDSYTYGQQPAGNRYPAGIAGVGSDGSGSVVGTMQDTGQTSYQLNNLIADNSPYIQQARQNAINQANSRGLLNSSISAGNAQGAAIQAAAPIAQANAAAYNNLQLDNLDNLNRIAQANIGAKAQVSAASASAGGQIGAANINNAGALQRQREDLAYSGEQAGLNRSFTSGMTQQQYQNQLGLQGQQYLNQYGLNQQQDIYGYGAQSALSAQNAQQNYAMQSGLSAQQYQQNLGLGQFNLGAGLLQGQQNFYNQLGIAGLSNPALIGDPTAFGGYAQFVNGLMGGAVDNIFNYVLGNNSYGGGY